MKLKSKLCSTGYGTGVVQARILGPRRRSRPHGRLFLSRRQQSYADFLHQQEKKDQVRIELADAARERRSQEKHQHQSPPSSSSFLHSAWEGVKRALRPMRKV